MFQEYDRARRLAREAKALNRKAKKHNGQLSSRDAQRLTKVSGSLVKYGIRDTESDQNGYNGNDWD